MERIYDCISKPDDHHIYEVMYGTTKQYRNVHGEKVPYNRDGFDPRFLYKLLPTKMIKTFGNYYACLRQRPEKKGIGYEYIPNEVYRYEDIKRTLGQLIIQIFPSRMWNELSLSPTKDQQLHPYTEWCPGSMLDFHHMETLCGISHVLFGSETLYRESKSDKAPTTATSRSPRKYQDHRVTVQKLHNLGVLDSQDKEYL